VKNKGDKNWIHEIYQLFIKTDNTQERYIKRHSAIVLLQELPELLNLLKSQPQNEKLDLIQRLFSSIDSLERPALCKPKRNEVTIDKFLKDFELDIALNKVPEQFSNNLPSVEIKSQLDDSFIYVEDSPPPNTTNNNFLSSVMLNQKQGVLESVILLKPTTERRFNVKKTKLFRTTDYIISFSEKSILLLKTDNEIESLFFYSMIQGISIQYNIMSVKIRFKGGDKIDFVCQNLKDVISINKLILSVLEL